jgi:crotonobetainyl-CoA:carnitine CoA-transferase CaiB-like acyl-CoA transferase
LSDKDFSGSRHRRAGGCGPRHCDLLAEPSFTERGLIQTMRHPRGELRTPTFPVCFDGAPPPVEPAPLLGQHTAEIFGDWLGMSAGDVEALREEGMI